MPLGKKTIAENNNPITGIARSLLTTLLQNASDILWLLDEAGRIIFVSPSVARLSGWTTSELEGHVLSEFVNEADAASLDALIEQLRQHPLTPLSVTMQLTYQDHSNLIEGTATNLLDDPHIGGILLNTHDVTTLNQTKEALEESRERFHRFGENAADLLFRWSYAKGFEYVNPASLEVVGYTPEEHYADPGLFYRNIHPDDIPIYESVFSDLADPTGPRRYCIIRWLHKDGHIKHVEMRMSPIFDERGNLISIEGIARDISQHIIARERLSELTARLTQAHEEERRRVAYELHDEIGQSLTVAKMRLRMAENALPEDAGRSRDKLGTLGTLIDETLQNVRALSHELRPPLLDEMGWEPALAGLCDSLSQRTGLPVIYGHTGGRRRLASDVELVAYRVVQEALTNIVRHADASQAVVSAVLSEQSLHITIEDDGQGFNVDDLFGSETPSVGLGLLGMQERVDAVGGKLDFHSEPGQGTTIDARLPSEEVTDEND
jgi:two-component system sensor histidine kinase UhpB